MSIEIANIKKSFGRTQVLNDISLDIPSGQMVALLGPSGSGKTTLLRIIAGLEHQTSGHIRFHGTDVSRLHARDRKVGFVFQHYALFRHMTVFDNIAFGLTVLPRRERPNAAAIKAKVTKLLEMVQLAHLADRYPAQLSGGQKQRVALARALAVEPQILLLDEPFGALDAQVRKELRRWLRQLHEELKFTSVFVTHDQEEALAVSDRIAVMNDGVIQQVGSPQYIYQRPANQFVSTFIGLSNIFSAKLTETEGKTGVDFGHYQAVMDNLDLRLLGIGDQTISQAAGTPVRVAVRPEEFTVHKDGEGIDAVVKSSVFLGISTHYFMETETGQEVEVIRPSDVGTIIPNGTNVKLRVETARINVFTEDGSRTLIRQDENSETGGEAL